MEFVYMGIFSSVFNWVLDKIFTPVFSWLAKLLNTVLSWIFNSVLAPLLEKVLWPLIEATLKLIMQILAGVFYSILAKLLTFVDNVTDMFDFMIGLKNVTYNGQSEPLLNVFVFDMPGVSKAFWLINCVGLGLALMLTIAAVTRSTLDLDFENRRPVSRVMTQFFKCFLNLFTVQIFVYFIIRLSAVILSGVNTAISQIQENGGQTTLGRIIFCVVSSNAALDTNYNMESAGAGISVGIMDKIRNPFYIGTSDYADANKVKESFDLAKFDYIMGYLLALFLLVVMVACVMVFIRRIYDILILYLASPYFIAMMPLDDGQKFSAWREMFIGKVFSGFGMVMAMKLYIMLCPSIMSSSVKFSSSTELDYMTKMIFLMGGAWATLKSGTVITSLISAGAGQAENMTANMTSGTLFAVGGRAAGAAAGAAMKGVGKLGQKAKAKSAESKQKFEDTKYNGSSTNSGKIDGVESGRSLSAGNTGGGGSEGTRAAGNAPAAGGTGTPGAPGNAPAAGTEQTVRGTEQTAPGTEQTTQSTGTPGETAPGTGTTGAPESESTAAPTHEAGTAENTFEGEGGSQNAEGPAGVGGGASGGGAAENPGAPGAGTSGASGETDGGFFAQQDKGTVTANYPMSFKKYKMKDGSERLGFKFGGSLLGVKRDGKGTKLQFLGMSVRLGADGKVNKFSILGMGSGKRGKDGKFHTSKLNIAGCKMRANSKDGKLQLTDFGLIGLHRERQENGEYRTTSIAGGLFQQSFAKQKDGTLQRAGVRCMGMNLMINEDAAKHNKLVKQASGIKEALAEDQGE